MFILNNITLKCVDIYSCKWKTDWDSNKISLCCQAFTMHKHAVSDSQADSHSFHDIMCGDICKTAYFLFYSSWLHVHSSVLNSWQTKKSTRNNQWYVKIPPFGWNKNQCENFSRYLQTVGNIQRCPTCGSIWVTGLRQPQYAWFIQFQHLLNFNVAFS